MNILMTNFQAFSNNWGKQFGSQVPKGLQFEGTLECGTMTSGRTHGPAEAW